MPDLHGRRGDGIPSSHDVGDKGSRKAWARLAACAGAAALLQLDGTLITVALPSLGRGLRVSGASTASALSAYFAAFALTLIPAGALVDRLGPRRLALVGLGLFGIGAVAGALAPSFGLLVATRVLQGAGAGLVSPAALAGAVSGFAPERRGRALGAWGASAGIANLIGPMLGGLLTVAVGWRAVWWALVPMTVASAAAMGRLAPTEAPDGPGGRPAMVLKRPILAAALIAALTFAIMIGTFYVAEQYLQHAAGDTPLAASSVLVLVALAVAMAAPLSGRLADTRGEGMPLALGFLIAAAGLGVLGLPVVSLMSVWSLVPMLAVGIGLGFLFAPTSRAALNAAPSSAHGRTSAVLSEGRMLGAAVGAGVCGLALASGVDTSRVQEVLLVAALLCVGVGVPAAAWLGAPARTVARPAPD